MQAMVPRIPKEDPKILAMHALSLSMGYACTPFVKLKRSLGAAIASRMRPREGKFLWQTGTGSVENFPRSAALEILPETMRAQLPGRPEAAVWRASSMMEVAALVGPLIDKYTSFSAGATKALMTESERVVRVVATVIPMMRFWWKEYHGIDTLYYEFQYILADEDGEMHKPKDAAKIEIALGQELETEIREQVLEDVSMMADAGVPLGPGFLRQLGRLDEAAEVEARLHRQSETAIGEKKRKSSKRTVTYDVECILDERAGTKMAEPTFLVRWEGYHPSWERWRATGNPGEAVTSWEPLSFLQKTEALQVWRGLE